MVSRRIKMAMDMFIKIDTLKGESVDKTHAGEIDVLAWSWGVSNSGSAHVGGGARRRRQGQRAGSVVHEVHRQVDARPAAGRCNGKHYDSALLTCARPARSRSST
jgi:type VI secretion system secreted protein Hcp